MLTFLFWNIAQLDLRPTITALVVEHKVDVLVLVECKIAPSAVCSTLSRCVERAFFVPQCNSSKVTLVTSFSPRFCKPLAEGNRYTIQALTLPGKDEFLLAAVHMPSKRNMSDESQMFECSKLSAGIRSAELARKHARTVLVGDFNMNPFESGMVGAPGFHGTMAREVAMRRTRTVQAQEYPFFYNPMWSCFGDFPDRPPGTTYYERAEHVCYFWGMFDQVLIRPDLVQSFDPASLRILTHAGSQPLVGGNGRPSKSFASDHLPILFKIQI